MQCLQSIPKTTSRPTPDVPAASDNSQSFATEKELAKLTAEWPRPAWSIPGTARVMNVTTATSGKEKCTMFTIDSDNNIAAHAEVPAAATNLQSFATEKELAKLTAEWPGVPPGRYLE